MSVEWRVDSLFFRCNCSGLDHLVEFSIEDSSVFDSDKPRLAEDLSFCVTPVLNFNRSFFRRIWIAIRYIFKTEPRFSYHFDTVQVNIGKELDDLEDMIHKVKLVAKIRSKNRKMI